jgi:hypothetical protein
MAQMTRTSGITRLQDYFVPRVFSLVADFALARIRVNKLSANAE